MPDSKGILYTSPKERVWYFGGLTSGSGATSRCLGELDEAEHVLSHMVAAFLTQIDPAFQGIELAKLL